MAGSINFKVYLVNKDFKVQEARRFTSDSDAITNFMYLREKLLSIFPKIRDQDFTIVWKDNEGDSISISSNEELEIALNETDPYVRKLYIILPVGNSKKMEDKSEAVLHPSVFCDACDAIIQGFRYKCVECHDYDLCSSCEALRLHPEHFMLRISQPMQWSSHSRSQLIREFKKFVIKMKKDKDDSCKSRSRRHHSGHSQAWSFPPSFSFSPFFDNFSEECPMKKPREPSNKTQSADAAKPCQATSSQEGGDEAKATPKTFKIPIIDIPGILEAFGIDIGVEVAVDKPSTSQSDATPETASQGTSPMGESASKKFPGEGKSLIDRKDDKDDKSDDKAFVSDREVPSNKESSAAKSAATDDWTMVDKTDTTNISRASSGSAISETASSLSANDIVAAKKNPVITPTVPSAPAETNLTDEIYPKLADFAHTIPHPDPKVQNALQTLISMGFTNEGGLCYLLQKEDCNITKVIDLLLDARRMGAKNHVE